MTTRVIRGDGAWRDNMPSAACPAHGLWLSWALDAAGALFTCSASRALGKPDCQLRASDLAVGAVVLHSVGLVYVSKGIQP